MASATLAGATVTFTKPDNSTFDLDLSGLQNDRRFVAIAYDHAENVITLTTEGGTTIEVDLDTDYPVPPPPPIPIPSSDATLSWLTIGGTTPSQWQPHFSPTTYSYDVSVPHAVVRAFVEPHPTDAAATFTVSDNHSNDDNDATATGRLVELPTGNTIVTVRATAEDGSPPELHDHHPPGQLVTDRVAHDADNQDSLLAGPAHLPPLRPRVPARRGQHGPRLDPRPHRRGRRTVRQPVQPRPGTGWRHRLRRTASGSGVITMPRFTTPARGHRGDGRVDV